MSNQLTRVPRCHRHFGASENIWNDLKGHFKPRFFGAVAGILARVVPGWPKTDWLQLVMGRTRDI
eukprot:6180900-Pleurochrysis_carterae.AAC.3